MCDGIPETTEELLYIFDDELVITDKLDDINIHDTDPKYTKRELVKEFEIFKQQRTV